MTVYLDDTTTYYLVDSNKTKQERDRMFEILVGLVVIGMLGVLAYVTGTSYGECNQNCNQGRNCTCKGKKE